jgi:hypothetical protein
LLCSALPEGLGNKHKHRVRVARRTISCTPYLKYLITKEINLKEIIIITIYSKYNTTIING